MSRGSLARQRLGEGRAYAYIYIQYSLELCL